MGKHSVHPATVTRYTCVFNDATASNAVSDGVIFKDMRCVFSLLLLSRTSYANSWTNPRCSCCWEEDDPPRPLQPSASRVFEAPDDFSWPFYFFPKRLTQVTVTRHLWDATGLANIQSLSVVFYAQPVNPHVRSIRSSFCGFHYGSVEPQAAWHVPQNHTTFLRVNWNHDIELEAHFTSSVTIDVPALVNELYVEPVFASVDRIICLD